MMDNDKTREQLIAENDELQRRVAALEDVDFERSRAEEELAKSKAILTAAVECLPFDFFALDPDGRCILQNAVSRRYYGNAVGKTAEQVCPDKRLLPRWLEGNRRALAGQKVEEEFALAVGDEHRNFYSVLAPIREDNTLYGILGVNVDITDRKRAEEALQKAHDELEQRVAETRLNEARLEAVLQLSHMTDASLKEITDFALEQAVALTESKIGYVAFMNEDETVLTMHSWSREAMAECAIADKPLAYPVVTTGLWGEAARQRKPIVTNDYPAPNPLKKGIPEGHMELRCHMNVPIIEDGRIVIVAGVGNKQADYNESDVRQLTLLMTGMWALIQRNRMQAELRQHRDHLEQLVHERTEALRQSEERYELAVRGVGVGIWDHDIQTGKVYYSPRWKMLFGYDEKDIGDSPDDWARLLHPDEREWILKLQEDFLAGTSPTITAEYRLRHKDGSYHWIVAHGLVVRDEQGRACRFVGSHGDITDRKRAEEALERERQSLWRMLQASDHERQIISYDIHDGLAQYLAAAGMQFQVFDAIRESNPEEAKKAYDAATQLVRQSHSESRRLINAVRPPVIDENGIEMAISHLVHEHRRHGGPTIKFDSDVQFKRLPSILENAIYRIVQEALTNACKHSNAKKMAVTLAQEGQDVRLEVRDWGIGFDPESVERGHFGLEGIRQRVRLLGGRVTIESTPGSGTLVQVVVPIVEQQDEE